MNASFMFADPSRMSKQEANAEHDRLAKLWESGKLSVAGQRIDIQIEAILDRLMELACQGKSISGS